jgi:DNA-binding MarR family transcriptional regulator
MPTNTPKKGEDGFDGKNEVLLELLTAVDRDSAISQRTISRELGVALGLANAYLKRCIRKGWIKVQHVPRRRYLYYLTAQGFAEKTRLSAEYLSSSFNFFRKTRAQLTELMQECVDRGCHRIAFAGVSDLAEMGTICGHDFDIDIVSVIDAEHAGRRFCGLPVVASAAVCGQLDAVIVTALNRPEVVYQELARALGPDRVLVPHMLRPSPPRPAGGVEGVPAE